MSGNILLDQISGIFENFDIAASDNNISHFVVRCCCDC